MEYVNKVIAFVVAYWKYISIALLFCAQLLIFFLKKRPVDGVKAQLLELIIKFIAVVEQAHPKGEGEIKKKEVIALVNEYLEANFPKLVGCYDAFISKAIESILNTPHKKGE